MAVEDIDQNTDYLVKKIQGEVFNDIFAKTRILVSTGFSTRSQKKEGSPPVSLPL